MIAAAIGAKIHAASMRNGFALLSSPNQNANLARNVIAVPIAAAIIQMAVSRSREYQADESGSYLSRDPEALAGALRKLDQAVRAVPPPASVSPAEAHLFIMNPLAGVRGGMTNLFSTHPATVERIKRLDAIALQLRGGTPIGR